MKNILLSFSLIVLFISACKPTKELGTAKSQPSKFLIKRLKEQTIDFKWFSGRIGLNYQSAKENFSATLKVRIQRDSAIWISGTKLAIEGVRVLITRDSLRILDRLARKYAVTDLGYLSRAYNLPSDFDALQQFLVGNPIFLDEAKQFKSKTNGSQHVLANINPQNIRTTYILNDADYQVDKLMLDDLTEKRRVMVQYSDYEAIEGKGNFAFFRNIELQSQQTGIIEADFNFSKAKFDEPQRMAFSIPRSYKRVGL